jgi:uncharacterized protein (TIGR00369 family)
MSAREMFLNASFVRWMGVELLRLENGVCETKLRLREDMLQQDGFAHAGIVTTLIDHSCGGAVGSLLETGEHVLTAEFKTSFLRAAKGPELFCRSRCVKRGRSLAFAEGAVYSSSLFDEASLLAQMTTTLAIRRLEA